jgi:peptidoglycan L-alanyl-D-glutamate endopeptidase CwlK
MVTTVDGNSFTVTEGNKNHAVGKRNMQVDGLYIRGFIAPNYANIAKKVAGQITPDNSSSSSSSSSSLKSTVSGVQTWLKNTYKLTIDIDGIYGPQTKACLVKGLQTELNKRGNKLDVDGIYGPKTSAAVVNIYKGASGNLVRVL